MRRRPGTTSLLPLDERLPLLTSTNSKCKRLVWTIIIAIIFAGVLAFALIRKLTSSPPSHGAYSIPQPRIPGPDYRIPSVEIRTPTPVDYKTHLAADPSKLVYVYDSNVPLSCMSALTRGMEYVSKVANMWTRLHGRDPPPLVIYAMDPLNLSENLEFYDQYESPNSLYALDWLSIVDKNLTCAGVLRDCAWQGAGLWNDSDAEIAILGQDKVLYRPRDHAIPTYLRMRKNGGSGYGREAPLCFQSLLGVRGVEENRVEYLAAQYWKVSEIRRVAQYIDSHADNSTHYSVNEVAENWCMKQGDRGATRITERAHRAEQN